MTNASGEYSIKVIGSTTNPLTITNPVNGTPGSKITFALEEFFYVYQADYLQLETNSLSTAASNVDIMSYYGVGVYNVGGVWQNNAPNIVSPQYIQVISNPPVNTYNEYGNMKNILEIINPSETLLLPYKANGPGGGGGGSSSIGDIMIRTFHYTQQEECFYELGGAPALTLEFRDQNGNLIKFQGTSLGSTSVTYNQPYNLFLRFVVS